MTGIELIAKERARQIEIEGWTPAHDASHKDGQLAISAICYATPPAMRKWMYTTMGQVPALWPWDWEWWKASPNNRVRELEKAGALIAAEIDRLLRLHPDVV